jgi:hypothetical protein
MMKVLTARVCLDCGEIHELDICPECLSRSWWYIEWWMRNVDPSKPTYPAASVALAEKLMN